MLLLFDAFVLLAVSLLLVVLGFVVVFVTGCIVAVRGVAVVGYVVVVDNDEY